MRRPFLLQRLLQRRSVGPHPLVLGSLPGLEQ